MALVPIPASSRSPGLQFQQRACQGRLLQSSAFRLLDFETWRYAAEGVYGLVRMARQQQYRVFVWRLAQRIAEFHFGHEVGPLTLRQDDPRDIFREDPS